MRRRHRPTTNSSMSLFPFLDTLVCTMGALILMLLAMTPKIKERALARMAAVQETADESAAAPAPVPSGPSAEEIEAERERRRNGWLAEAEAARTALEQRQSHYRVTHQQLAEAEKRLRELQDQILKARLKSENTEQVEETLEERAEKLEAQAALIAQKIAATRKNLDVANRRQANAPNEYALVAYDGVSGTTRRPIYIECTGQGFRFLPEGEMISASDIEGFTDNFNPLLTGARTLIQFWARRRRAAGPSEPEPYVLLLVRPSGCLSYYVARKSLSSLGAHWGYELIEEDWKLSVPDPDPLAKDLLKDTLAATMQARRPQRREIVLSGDRGRSTFDPAELFESDANSLSGDRGEFGGGRPARAGGRRPSIQQGYATRNDRAPRELPPTEKAAGTIDVNDSRAATGSGQGDGWADARAAGRGEKAGTGVGPGSAVAANMSGKNRGATNASGPRGAPAWGAAGEAGGLSSDRSSAAGDDITGAAIQAPPELAENTIAGATGAAGNSGPGGPSPRGKFSASGGNRAPRARPATLGGIATAEDGSGDQAGDADTGSAGNFEGGTAASDGSLVPLSGSQTGGDPDFPGENAGVAGSRTRGQVGGKQTDPAAGDPSASTTASSAAQAGNPDGNPQLSSPSWLDGSADDGSAAGNAGPMGGPGLNVRLGSKKSRRRPDGENSEDGPRISENGEGQGSPMRGSGPRKWGQVGRKAGIGFEKRIKIYLNDKRIVVDNKKFMMLLDANSSSDDLVNFAASSIDAIADSWGEPPANFYWVPVVQFIVYPKGDANYERLRLNLEQKWGVSSSVEYVTDRKDNKTKAANGAKR